MAILSLRLVIMGCDILGKDEIFQSVRNGNEVVTCFLSQFFFFWREFVISFLKHYLFNYKYINPFSTKKKTNIMIPNRHYT